MVGEVASLVSVDKDTENWENIEYARMRVRLLRSCKASLNKDIKTNGVIYSVIIEEEAICGNEGKCKDIHNPSDLLDSASTMGSYVEETLFSKNNPEEEWMQLDEEEAQTAGLGRKMQVLVTSQVGESDENEIPM